MKRRLDRLVEELGLALDRYVTISKRGNTVALFIDNSEANPVGGGKLRFTNYYPEDIMVKVVEDMVEALHISGDSANC